jgi:hypothetical protein
MRELLEDTPDIQMPEPEVDEGGDIKGQDQGPAGAPD